MTYSMSLETMKPVMLEVYLTTERKPCLQMDDDTGALKSTLWCHVYILIERYVSNWTFSLRSRAVFLSGNMQYVTRDFVSCDLRVPFISLCAFKCFLCCSLTVFPVITGSRVNHATSWRTPLMPASLVLSFLFLQFNIPPWVSPPSPCDLRVTGKPAIHVPGNPRRQHGSRS